MAHGTPKGTVTGVYSNRVDDLIDKAKKISLAFRRFDQLRPWHTPDPLKDKDLLLVPGLHNPPWSRDEPNIVYCESVLAGPNKSGGTAADLIAMKLQIDFLAEEERAWRTRHMSLIRAACLAHGRLDGHSKKDEERGVFGRARKAIKDYIAAGSAMTAP